MTKVVRPVKCMDFYGEHWETTTNSSISFQIDEISEELMQMLDELDYDPNSKVFFVDRRGFKVIKEAIIEPATFYLDKEVLMPQTMAILLQIHSDYLKYAHNDILKYETEYW